MARSALSYPLSSRQIATSLLCWHRLRYTEANAIGYAKFRRRSHDAVIRVYDAADNVIETHEHAGEFKEW